MGWREKTYVIDSHGFEEHWGWRKKRIAWDEVVEIIGHNGEMLAYTSIWFLIRDSKRTEIWIEQLKPAFKTLNKVFEERYEGYPKNLLWMGELEIDGVGHQKVLWSKLPKM